VLTTYSYPWLIEHTKSRKDTTHFLAYIILVLKSMLYGKTIGLKTFKLLLFSPKTRQ